MTARAIAAMLCVTDVTFALPGSAQLAALRQSSSAHMTIRSQHHDQSVHSHPPSTGSSPRKAEQRAGVSQCSAMLDLMEVRERVQSSEADRYVEVSWCALCS